MFTMFTVKSQEIHLIASGEVLRKMCWHAIGPSVLVPRVAWLKEKNARFAMARTDGHIPTLHNSEHQRLFFNGPRDGRVGQNDIRPIKELTCHVKNVSQQS